MATKRNRSDPGLQLEFAMVDAIREIIGLAPLYAADPMRSEEERFAPLATYPDPVDE